MSIKNKVLFLDIETLPNLAWTWGKYQQDVLDFKQEGCIASFACKWLGQKKTLAFGLPSYGRYRGDYDDSRIVRHIWKFLDEAEVVVAHNGKVFDLRVITGRFIVHGLKPPSPYKVVDTKMIAKRVARFNSNKLDDLGRITGLGRKLHTSFGLWRGCIEGDRKAWKTLLKYNKQDVILLERLYLKLRAYDTSHPNMALYSGARVCPRCGGARLVSNGYRFAATRMYKRLQCLDCGSWSRETQSSGSVGVSHAV